MNALMALLWMLAAWLGGADHDPACLVLGGLDAVRSEALATGHTARLQDVYVDERAARADIALVRSYRARDLRVEGAWLVRESCRVTDRSSERITLDVVDRLGPAVAVLGDGSRRALPRDRATRRTVVLRRPDHVWRIASVQDR